MNQSDILYRAFLSLKEQTSALECSVMREAIALSNPEGDAVEVIKESCLIEEDWIAAIETGLKHIEKAINEYRQFIRTEGGIIPIEKVKRVSRDSTEHLARHSDLITKEQEGKNLLPDKLYITERLSDFAVYENRFLYMLLKFLDSFVGIRYNKIIELTNTYHGSVAMNKTVLTSKRLTSFELKMTDEIRDDIYLKEHNKSQPLIDRIADIAKTVTHLLNTPLMQEVAKSPPLKPPVTKTNVLKMNRNFKGATALYDFITAYDKDGYTVVKKTERIKPFPENVANEFAQTVMLTAFLTYKHGLKIEKFLKSRFDEDEKKRKAEEKERRIQELAALKRRISELGEEPFEYILLLEKHNKTLEADSQKLNASREELNKMSIEAEAFKKNIQLLNQAVDEKQAQIEAENIRFALEKEALKSAHEQEKTAIKNRHKGEVAALDEKLRQTKTEFTGKESALNAKIENLEGINAQKTAEYEQLLAQKRLSESKLTALRKEHNLIGENEDFTARETFEELELQYRVFKEFFKAEWKKTKKKIRKKILKGAIKSGGVKSNEVQSDVTKNNKVQRGGVRNDGVKTEISTADAEINSEKDKAQTDETRISEAQAGVTDKTQEGGPHD